MAQTKKKRRRKHRGTQSGRIDTRPRRGRARSRQEAKDRARAKPRGGPRPPRPPTWGGAILKGAVAAVLFFGLMAFAFDRPTAPSLALAGFMLLVYIPLSYVTDGFFYRRRLRTAEKQRIERAQRGKRDGA